jgi:hypothetical protein
MATTNGRRATERQEERTNRVAEYLHQRKTARHIDVDSEDVADSVDETTVTTKKSGYRLPDMRFAANRNRYLIDKSKRLDGRPDERLVENRPDIQALHEDMGDDTPNLSLNEDGTPKE